MNVMPRTTGVSALQEELRAKGVRYVIGAYVDIHGAQKAKVVPLDHLAHMAEGSELYTGYALDGLGQLPNDDEFASVPDLDRVIQLPWEPKLAWAPADLAFHGELYPLSTRVALKRQIAEHYAAEEGLVATMMPKPFPDRTGNGAHFNMSLKSLETGRNAFACKPVDDPRGLGLTETGYHFIGGVLRHGRALCAAFAPTVNSYKRLVRRGAMATFSWAPVFNSYGSNNRTNSVRVPMGGGRCESRNADGAVNPYLAATLVLAAGLEGVREKIDPGEPNEDNLYDLDETARTARGIEFLPQTLLEAVQAFAADPLVEATLGTALRDEFVRYKTDEWNEYHQTISVWETTRYSHMF